MSELASESMSQPSGRPVPFHSGLAEGSEAVR
jgi:hypothetical protein